MRHLPPEAALWREMDPETAAWSTTLMVADLVAGVLDSLREDPIPRPWFKPTPDDDEWELTGDTFDSIEEAKAYFDERAGR